MKNKNLLYLIPSIIVGGFLAYVANKQNEKFKKEQEELSEFVSDFGNQVMNDRNKLQTMVNCLIKEQEDVVNEFMNHVNKKDAE